MYEKYRHHGNDVWVRSDLKGKHWDYCLCSDCYNFNPGMTDNCAIAEQVYQLDVELGLVTPVWECPYFTRRKDENTSHRRISQQN
jgi:hypothetical protein